MEGAQIIMKNGKTKLISINLSNNCIQEPKCSFCYLSGKEYKSSWKMHNIIDKYANKKTTVCIEYNGYNLSYIFKNWYLFSDYKVTMTTMPCVITNTFCGAMKHLGVKAISLSYDSQKVISPQEWFVKAQLIKQNKINLGCNFLIEKIPFEIPNEIIRVSDQLNLLSLKPIGKFTKKQLTFIKLKIEQLKSLIPITTDNCLGFQLGLINECKKGKDFIHISINGKAKECCFEENCFLFNTKS